MSPLAVVIADTHIPRRANALLEGLIPFLEDEDDLMLLDPGSPTDKRCQPRHTFALFRAEEGRVTAEIVAL